LAQVGNGQVDSVFIVDSMVIMAIMVIMDRLAKVGESTARQHPVCWGTLLPLFQVLIH